ncbi:MAG: hypothetical protein EP335_05185 [Alphaproteobacteria bacterium]|nr:MAG: hypothetical protein EP335_05185 [Alphaproteobacteria bacterium]
MVIQVPDAISHPDVPKFFGKREYRELHLDIGCGLGGFLIAAARQHPDNAYVGLDINSRSLSRLAASLNFHNLPNALALSSEGRYFLETSVRFRSISAIHVYFPTPYIRSLQIPDGVEWKVRSRLLEPHFLQRTRQVLTDGGSLRVVSDHREYMANAREAALQVGYTEVPWRDHIKSSRTLEIIGTGCEREMLNLGKDIHTLMFM